MQTIQGLKYIWKLPLYQDKQSIASLAAQYNISYPVIQVLTSRGMTDSKTIDNYLFSSYEKDVSSPALLKDAEKAVDRILAAIEKKEKILICGDYDVDGITSSAMMMLCLTPLGADINYFLPHRIHDGYGLSVKTVKRAAANNYRVLITVDNGISAFEPAREAKALDIDLIITDHHQPHEQVPDAYAVIDPYQQDCPYPYKKFAGVGVSFKILSLLYEKIGRELPEKVYELLMLGTVADVVPLTGENRFWTRHGLAQAQRTQSFALEVLKENARVTKPTLSSTDIGFFITPQINALGRLEDARDGVKFLIGSNHEQVVHVGKLLQTLNESRKAIEKSIFDQVDALIKSKQLDITNKKIIIAAQAGWQPGVIGLVASRLVGTYGRPTILLHLTKDGLAKGSCRSIPECNMFKALQSVSDLLENFGGHAAAAGLSLKVEKLPEFTRRLETLLDEQLTATDIKPKLRIDSELTLAETSIKLVTDLQLLEPFGCENPQPLFFLRGVSLIEAPQILKEVHIKCKIVSEGIAKSVMFFNRPDLIAFFERIGAAPFDCAVQVTQNHWNGRVTVELQGYDVAEGETA
jgi:single-stranded-DNA-specific exonuclease